jgi:hypothetical protein
MGVAALETMQYGDLTYSCARELRGIVAFIALNSDVVYRPC